MNKMGQLEVYSINEVFLLGMVIGLFLTYFMEEYESNTFESYKSYSYSIMLVRKKIKRISLTPLYIRTQNIAIFKS
jgi:hypothetical protein